MKRRLLVTADEALRATQQHDKPCSDCPWRRDSVPGWTGSMTPEEWTRAAHGESRIDCHVHLGAQCAGAATYRANVCKTPRGYGVIRLEKDRARVFASPFEFQEHHARPGPPPKRGDVDNE